MTKENEYQIRNDSFYVTMQHNKEFYVKSEYWLPKILSHQTTINFMKVVCVSHEIQDFLNIARFSINFYASNSPIAIGKIIELDKHILQNCIQKILNIIPFKHLGSFDFVVFITGEESASNTSYFGILLTEYEDDIDTIKNYNDFNLLFRKSRYHYVIRDSSIQYFERFLQCCINSIKKQIVDDK